MNKTLLQIRNELYDSLPKGVIDNNKAWDLLKAIHIHLSELDIIDKEPLPQPQQPESKPQFGEWQLCPKCMGDGHLYRYNSPAIITTDASLVCDVCNGNKVIQKPQQPVIDEKELRDTYNAGYG